MKLRDEGNVDEETLGMLARTYMDQAFAPSVTIKDRQTWLRRALAHYREAYVESDGFRTGINVTTHAGSSTTGSPRVDSIAVTPA